MAFWRSSRLIPALATLILLGMAGAAHAVEAKAEAAYGVDLEGFDYPYPVRHHSFASQGQQLSMAYMDVAPADGAAKGVVVLLHGKNFCAATWEATIKTVVDAGYRAIAPDQVGFCKSSKPERYQFSFQQLARNTHDLLMALKIKQPVMLLGHSTGGMLAIRYALMYPQGVAKLLLVDPIGLEDWKALGVPSLSVDDWYQRELKTNAASLKSYEQKTYYAGTWRPDYDKWVDMLAGLYAGPGKAEVAWDSALIDDMIYTQPVYYELYKVAVPTVLFIGDKDTTAIGKDAASPQVQAMLGHYPELGKRAARLIPHATLVEFANLGHAPQIQDPATFHRALLNSLN